jgi:formate hydrogenlyase subunit 4
MFGVLISNFALPPMVPLWGKIIIAIVVMAVFAVVVGLLESFRARNRMKRNPQFIFTLTSIAILVFFTVLILTNKLVL